MKDFLLDLFFPKKCVVCKTKGDFLCSDCQKRIIFIKQQACLTCGKITKKGEFCKRCRPKTNLTGIIISTHYEDGPLKELLHSYKYEGLKEADRLLSSFMIKNLQSIGFLPPFVPASLSVIPAKAGIQKTEEVDSRLRGNDKTIISKKFTLTSVPIHKSKLNHRGYNQTELLARILAKKTQMEYLPDLLYKKNKTTPQIGLKRKERLLNQKNVFVLNKKYQEMIKGKNILIIDDIVTTGATLDACAKELRKANTKEIWGIVLGKH